METGEVIGTMCLMDSKYYWCSYQEQVITMVIHPIDQLLLLADNEIHVYDDGCEFCGCCFNMDCEYNTDKKASYVVNNTTTVDWSEEGIHNVQKAFRDMDNILHEDDDTISMLNKSTVVTSGYKWTVKKNEK